MKAGLAVACMLFLMVAAEDELEWAKLDANNPSYYELTMTEVIHSLHSASRMNGGFSTDPVAALDEAKEDPVTLFLISGRRSRPRRSAKSSNFHYIPSRG